MDDVDDYLAELELELLNELEFLRVLARQLQNRVEGLAMQVVILEDENLRLYERIVGDAAGSSMTWSIPQRAPPPEPAGNVTSGPPRTGRALHHLLASDAGSGTAPAVRMRAALREYLAKILTDGGISGSSEDSASSRWAWTFAGPNSASN